MRGNAVGRQSCGSRQLFHDRGHLHGRIARLHNDPASSDLTVTGTTQIDWQLGGSAPEVEHVQFAYWENSAWQDAGNAQRVAGGWRAEGVSLPTSSWVRARGRIAVGYYNSSSSIMEAILPFGGGPFPAIGLYALDEALVSGLSTLDFGTQQWWEVSAPILVTITNSGDAVLEDLSLELGGRHAGDFSFSPLSVTSLAPGESTTVALLFSPLGAGNRGSLLSVSSSDGGVPSFTVFLTGIGLHGEEGFQPVANAPVHALALQADGKILLGGEFTRVGGQFRNHIARLNADGTLDESFDPNADASVSAFALQPDGKILVGGNFATLGGQPRNRIARLKPDGSLDNSFHPDADAWVSSLALQSDGKILVAGSFGTIGGQPRNRIARLNSDGTLDESFDPGAGANSAVRSLLLQSDSRILLGGDFTNAVGQARNYIARLHADGTLDEHFDPNPNDRVFSLAVQSDGKILVGGVFTSIGGELRTSIARLNADGTLDDSFNADANAGGWVRSFALQADGKIVVGGGFASIGGQLRSRIARLNPDGSADVSFDPNANGSVSALALQSDGSIVVGGHFMVIGELWRSRIARLNNDPASSELIVTGTTQIDWQQSGSAPEVAHVQFAYWDGSAWQEVGSAQRVAGGWQAAGLSLPTSTWVRAQGWTDGGGYGGSFSIIETILPYGGGLFPAIGLYAAGGALVSGRSTLDFGTQQWQQISAPILVTISNSGDTALEELSVEITGRHAAEFSHAPLEVTSLAPGESTSVPLLFNPLGGGHRGALLSVSSSDRGRTPFTAVLTGTGLQADSTFNLAANQRVYSLALQPNGRILVGGLFTSIGGQTRNRIARLNADGSVDASFNADVNSQVTTLALQPDGKILIGGHFSSIGGQTFNRIARLNENGSVDAGFNPNANIYVSSLVLQPDGKILVGGLFSIIGGQSRGRIARLNVNGTLDTSFTPNPNGEVSSIALQPDGKILIGGSFSSISGQSRSRIARLHADGTLDTSFDPNASGAVNCLVVQPDGKILVGGNFSSIGGEPHSRIARLNSDGTLDTSFVPNADAAVYSMVLQSDGKILVGGDFSTIAGHVRSRIARLNPDGSADTSFDPHASSSVYSVALQADGNIWAGGAFLEIGGQAQTFVARLNNDPASSVLTITGSTQIDWQLGGSAPEVEKVQFSYRDGNVWRETGSAQRVPGGWQAVDLDLPANVPVRAQGRTMGGYYNGSSGIIEAIFAGSQAIDFPAIPDQVTTNTVRLSATATSGLRVSFSVASGPATIRQGTILTFTGPGTVSVVASQNGNVLWNSAAPVTNTFSVSDVYTVTVVSAHGETVPPLGDHLHVQDTVITNAVISPYVQGTTRYVVSGWTLTGHQPASGSGAQVVFAVTNNAVLTWDWDTQYWLETQSGPNGAVDIASSWQDAGSIVEITAQPDAYYTFEEWSGSISSIANPLNLLMNGSKTVTAHFAALMTTNHPTPHWWLAQYGITNDLENAVSADPDEDRVPTWKEFIMDTDPMDPDSCLRVTNIVPVLDTNCVGECEFIGLQVTFPVSTNRVYDIESANRLDGEFWEPVGGSTNIMPAATSMSVTNLFGAEEMEHIRIRVRLP